MNKLLLGITAAFALSVVAPSISLAEESKEEKPAKAEKKGKGKGKGKAEEKKEDAK